MRPLENMIFGPDPWWIVLIKVVGVFVLLLAWTIINVWFERRVLGFMQNRRGPSQNGPIGILQAVGDGLKLAFKELFTPKDAHALVFNLAPLIAGIAAFTSWAVIPLGGQVSMFGHTTNLQITDLPVAVLFVLAIASIGIYGIVLAGWASNGTYALLGAMRASAQMISYEIAMGLSLVAVFLSAGTMSTSGIVQAQSAPISIAGFNTGLPGWYALLLIPSFVIYVIAMFGEANRTPFDFAECEQELVAGYNIEYTGFPYGVYYLAEYINMATLSAICTTLVLGGYRAPWPFNNVSWLEGSTGWIGLVWFLLKVQLVIFFFVWTRAAIPRFRYDKFMDLGWKWLIPISLVWIMAVAILKTARTNDWFGNPIFLGLMAALVFGLLAISFLTGKEARVPDEPEDVFDAFAGGYPVPPMPGQVLPELSGVVRSTASAATDAADPTIGADS